MQHSKLLVGQILYQFQQLWIAAEELLAQIGSVFGLEVLEVAIHTLFHPLQQQARPVARKEVVPVRTPDHLNHIPARTPEHTLQLVNDPLIAAHRPVESLQVAVHHKDQVVEPLTCAQRDRSQRIYLVAFAVAQKAPNFAFRLLD